jgi:hypothetical protein
MGLVKVSGGSHLPPKLPAAGDPLATAAQLPEVRSAKYDPESATYTFVIDAPTTPSAFSIVTGIFRPSFGSEWWPEVSAVPHFN